MNSAPNFFRENPRKFGNGYWIPLQCPGVTVKSKTGGSVIAQCFAKTTTCNKKGYCDVRLVLLMLHLAALWRGVEYGLPSRRKDELGVTLWQGWLPRSGNQPHLHQGLSRKVDQQPISCVRGSASVQLPKVESCPEQLGR